MTTKEGLWLVEIEKFCSEKNFIFTIFEEKNPRNFKFYDLFTEIWRLSKLEKSALKPNIFICIFFTFGLNS